MQSGAQRGASLVELLVSIAVVSLVMVGLAGMLIQNLKVSRREQLRAEAQDNARNCIARTVATLRSAGWDPGDYGIPVVALDADLSDPVSQIEVFIDRNGDGVTSGTPFEQILIRHVGDRVEWRTDGAGGFSVMARRITNDADGDGTIEPMFTPDSTTNPKQLRIQVTSQASSPDPETRQPIRHTMTSQVVLRKRL